ncbi:hypothetical protein KY347_05085 [Candidatus Woesearchaeota archaeon]|nr:hypothetical protein [Candidatus Woesearchaeota archaeon]
MYKCDLCPKKKSFESKSRIGLSSHIFWKHFRDYTLLLTTIIFILGILVTFGFMKYSECKEERQYLENKELLKPNISVEVFSGDVGSDEARWIQLQIGSTKSDTNKVDKLDFYFDIPGLIINLTEDRNLYRINCEHHRRTFNMEGNTPFLERIYITCEEMYPQEYYTLFFYYQPYEEIQYNFYKARYGVLYDKNSFSREFHNYLKYGYYWHYNNELIFEEKCSFLGNLSYMGRENSKLWNFLSELKRSAGENNKIPDTMDEHVKHSNPCEN